MPTKRPRTHDASLLEKGHSSTVPASLVERPGEVVERARHASQVVRDINLVVGHSIDDFECIFQMVIGRNVGLRLRAVQCCPCESE